MIEQDTIKLLRECDAGIKMGVDSINEVIDHVKNKGFRDLLKQCKEEHKALDRDLQEQLDRFGDEGKNPNPMAKGMSWIKTNVMLAVEDSDKTVADLMTDGCHMDSDLMRSARFKLTFHVGKSARSQLESLHYLKMGDRISRLAGRIGDDRHLLAVGRMPPDGTVDCSRIVL
jgi:hypothetical protein